MNDLLHTNVYGTQEEVKQHPIFQTLYKDLYDIDFKDTFFALNLHLTFPEKILNHSCNKIVLSYHTEHLHHYTELYDIFYNNRDKKFLIISDFSSFNIEDDEAETDFWPENVTTTQWLSWGEQVEMAKKITGVAEFSNIPTKKISSLSNRHEYHKAATTAFIFNNFLSDDIILSWHNNLKDDHHDYYLRDDFFIPKQIQKELFDREFCTNERILFDDDDLEKFNNPLCNINWHNDAYTKCVINVTNESTFSSIGRLNNEQPIIIPGPFITEKTIKPLLSGTAFLHVGHPFLLEKLNELGINTNFGFPNDYDKEPYEDERILKLYDTLEFIRNTPTMKIYEDSYDAINHNLQHIKSGKFLENCKKHNIKNLNTIIDWNSGEN